jgi:hypothetical protein
MKVKFLGALLVVCATVCNANEVVTERRLGANAAGVFDTEILPEVVIDDSPYGKLTFSAVRVSEDERRALPTEINELIDDISKYDWSLADKDLAKPWGEAEISQLASGIYCYTLYSWSRKAENTLIPLYSAVRMRIFERHKIGDCGLSISFYCSNLSETYCDLFRYNDREIALNIVYTAAVYLKMLHCRTRGASSSEYSGLYANVMRTIMERELPANNYISWALGMASNDEQAQKLVDEQKVKFFL